MTKLFTLLSIALLSAPLLADDATPSTQPAAAVNLRRRCSVKRPLVSVG